MYWLKQERAHHSPLTVVLVLLGLERGGGRNDTKNIVCVVRSHGHKSASTPFPSSLITVKDCEVARPMTPLSIHTQWILPPKFGIGAAVKLVRMPVLP
jgi:hypothetical protein